MVECALAIWWLASIHLVSEIDVWSYDPGKTKKCVSDSVIWPFSSLLHDMSLYNLLGWITKYIVEDILGPWFTIGSDLSVFENKWLLTRQRNQVVLSLNILMSWESKQYVEFSNEILVLHLLALHAWLQDTDTDNPTYKDILEEGDPKELPLWYNSMDTELEALHEKLCYICGTKIRCRSLSDCELHLGL